MKDYLREQTTVEVFLRHIDTTQSKIKLLEEAKDAVLNNKDPYNGKNSPSERAMLSWIKAQIKKYEKVMEDEAMESLNKEAIYELNEVEKLALNNVCKGAKHHYKRDILTEYLILEKELTKKVIRDEFETKHELNPKTFYQWVQALDDEIKDISRA